MARCSCEPACANRASGPLRRVLLYLGPRGFKCHHWLSRVGRRERLEIELAGPATSRDSRLSSRASTNPRRSSKCAACLPLTDGRGVGPTVDSSDRNPDDSALNRVFYEPARSRTCPAPTSSPSSLTTVLILLASSVSPSLARKLCCALSAVCCVVCSIWVRA
jgi:hypothetical protein